MTPLLLPPGPGSVFPGAQLLPFRRDPAGFLLSMAREYGDVVGFRFGPQRVFLLNPPDYIQEVLVARHRNFVKSRALQQAKVVLGEGLLTSKGDSTAASGGWRSRPFTGGG